MSNPRPAGVAAPDPAHLTGQVLDDCYEVAEKIGAGGCAFVYLAHDRRTGEQVAIKCLLPELTRDATAMARLRREAALGAKLEHPNLCHILHIGRQADFEYVVMPFLDGELLCARAWRAGPLPLEQAARYLGDMCAGLDHAHQRGVIHRDLKPENVMLAKGTDGTERAVIMDFGLATARDMGADTAKLTRTGLVVGTPEFMSPEQMCGQPVDPRSDVYSLAFMTYELLTGQLPFEGKTQHQLMVARLKGVAIPLRARRPDLNFPQAVEQVLAKALLKEPAERYPSMPALAEAFLRAAGVAVSEPADTSAPAKKLFGWLRRT